MGPASVSNTTDHDKELMKNKDERRLVCLCGSSGYYSPPPEGLRVESRASHAKPVFWHQLYTSLLAFALAIEKK